jgi:hypothetical protein
LKPMRLSIIASCGNEVVAHYDVGGVS